MSSCSVGNITRAAARCHHNTRAVKHPTRTAQLRHAGAAGSKGQSRLFPPAVPMALGAALARLGGRCSRTATPVGEAVKAHRPSSNTRRATNPNNATSSPLFILFYLRCLSFCPITDTKNRCTPSQKGRNKEKRRHDPTVTPRVNTLVHPPPLPRRGPQSHRRVDTTMCTTPSCSEQWAGHGHASPRSILPPLKCCVPAQSSKQNQSAHKPNHPLTR
ncbi:hypothetical protein TcCL_Unassigned01974 [Trypanosoma cruzi]|nr:hypothetical protein TcCL_Unassigned01974 [Trypanosoma cruzi]